jgi:hypothetical protein
LTTGNFVCVTNTVAVRVVQHNSTALARLASVGVGENAFCGVGVKGSGIVVASVLIQTTVARLEITRTVAGVRQGVVVASSGIGATEHWQNTVASVFCGIRVVVKRSFVRAAQNFVRITYAIHVGVNARPIAVESRDWVNT